jgi:hypothetical protein
MRTRTAPLLAMLLASSGVAAETPAAPSCPGPPARGVPVRSLGAAGAQLLLDESFPDPFVARFGRAYHGYATGVERGGVRMNVQAIRSPNLTEWSARPTRSPMPTSRPGSIAPIRRSGRRR